MTNDTLPPLPATTAYGPNDDYSERTTPYYTADQMREYAASAVAAERDACISIIETHRIPVGNSAAGEMACEWTYNALHEIRDAIRARNAK